MHLIHVGKEADHSGAVAIIRDISGQRRLEQELLAVDERSRLFVENADEGIVVVQDGKVVFLNQRAADLSGRPIEEHLSKPFLEDVHPADQETVRGQHLRRLKGKPVPRVYSFRVARADGSVRWAEVSAVSHTWEGKPAFLCFVKDITERKKVEDKLRESERRYRLLAENASDVIWVTDMNLRATYLSPSIKRLLGYSMEESMRHTVEGALTPASVEAVQKVLAGVVARGRERSGMSGGLEVELKRKDGSTVWVESTVSFILGPDGQPVEIMGVLRDISKRKLAEEALREAKAKLDLLLQQMPCLCWTTDTELRFSSCAGALISVSRLDQLMGTNLSDYYGVDGKEHSTPLSAHRQALAGTPDSYEVEQSGRVFYCRVEPLRDAGNDLVGVVGAAVDITDYKNLVSQLRTLSRRLISVQEDERRAIASELHDQVGQSLTALKLLLEKAQATASESDVRKLAVAGGVVNELMTRVREMSLDLRRPVGRMHDAPGAVRHARTRRRQHVRDPGRARGRRLPQAEQFARQPVPGQSQQRRGALLLVQAALRGESRLRGGKAFASQRTLFFERLAHAGTRVGMGLRLQLGWHGCSHRRGCRAPLRAVGLDQFEQRRVFARQRLLGDVHASSPSCVRNRAARSGNGTSPCRSGTISTSGTSADSARRSAARRCRRPRPWSPAPAAPASAPTPARPLLRPRGACARAHRRAGSPPR